MDIPEVTQTSPPPVGGWQTKRGVISAALCCAVIIPALWAIWLLSPIQSSARDMVEFVVTDGQGTRAIASSLEEQQLVRSDTAFVIYTRLMGIQADLKAGTYLLSRGMSVSEIADVIAGGKGISDDIEVTVPEGSNIWEVDQILTKAKLTKLGLLSKSWNFKEGHLFPDTYRFAKDATLEDIVNKMEATYFVKGKTRSDIDVIIASILEKEAKTAEDMALVAGIIFKRQELGMPLQIDATVGYGWCLRVTRAGNVCDVTQAPIATEIKVDGPYNTYTRTGLPVASISNPGVKALTAAAHPKKSDYLYYLSTRDGSQLIYSKTLQEHLKNRQKYLGF